MPFLCPFHLPVVGEVSCISTHASSNLHDPSVGSLHGFGLSWLHYRIPLRDYIADVGVSAFFSPYTGSLLDCVARTCSLAPIFIAPPRMVPHRVAWWN